MNAPSAIAHGGSSPISLGHRNPLGEAANGKDFHAHMDSLAEKDGATKKADAHESSSSSAPKPNASGPALRNGSGPPVHVSALVQDSSARGVVPDADPALDSKTSGNSRSSKRQATERQDLASPGMQTASSAFELAQARSAGASAALSAASSNGHERPPSAAFRDSATTAGGESNFSSGLRAELQSLLSSDMQTRGAAMAPSPALSAGASSASSAISSNGQEHPPSAAFHDSATTAGGASNFSSGLGAELQSLLSSDMQTRGATMAPSSGRSAGASSASSAMSSNVQEEPISAAITSVANEMQLRVTRATTHFDSWPAVNGRAASQPKAVLSSFGQEDAETPVARPASSTDSAGGRDSVDARVSNDSDPVASNESADPPALIFPDVPFSLVPQALGQVAATLSAAQAPSMGAAIGVAEPVPRASGAMTRELEIHLTPSGLGSLLVKMKLSEGALSVVIEASKPSTLSAVESARNDIIERLAATSQGAASLEVKPLQVSQTQLEDANAGSDGPAARDHSQGQSDAGQNLPDRRGGREIYHAEEQSPLGGARHLVL